jgi:hypothetical protein
MSTGRSQLNPSPAAIAELQQQAPRVQAAYAAQRVWERLLSDADRRLAGGDIDVAFSDGGAIGLWSRLRGVSRNRALVELAERLGFLGRADAAWLLRELGEPSEAPPAQSSESRLTATIPRWDQESRQLFFEGVCVRKIASLTQASNITRILDAFEEQSWPPRIDDPLPGGRDQTRLHATIASLNERLSAIEFHGDGSGEGIEWRTRSL